jgi:DNA mismatch repair protein MutL
MAAVADLEIVSAVDGSGAHRFTARPGRDSRIDAVPGKRGTSVSVMRLFESFPARRRFLKRPATETSLVSQTFIDRALSQTDIEFRLNVDGKMRLFLPPSSLKARVLSAYALDEPESFFHESKGNAGGFSYRLVFGGPEIRRPDRRHIQCFVNGRRVQDFSLQKAMEIAYSGFLPGGAYPLAFLFISIDPEKIDFNIHPAKKEIRFRDPSSVHSDVVKALRAALSATLGAPSANHAEESAVREGGFGFDSIAEGESRPSAPSFSMSGEKGFARPSIDELRAVAESRPSLRPEAESRDGFRVIGQCLGVFILVESGDDLYLLDQHAAHERMLFDQLESRPARAQELLVPYVFDCESEADDEFLSDNQEELLISGYAFQREGQGRWALCAHPEGLKGKMADIVSEIVSQRGSASPIRRALHALTACRSAIKEGETLDARSMEELAGRAFRLPEPKCPHGRPVWIRMGREELYRRILRIVD